MNTQDNIKIEKTAVRRIKKVGKISAMISKSTIWYPLKVTLMVLWKFISYTINILFTLILIGIITGVVVGCAFILYIQGNVDTEYEGLNNLKFETNLDTKIYYTNRNGDEILMQEDTLYAGENSLWAAYRDIPQNLVNAVVAIEDKRFFDHKGVDLKRTVGAVLNFIMPSGGSYGGSTITQQLIKNVSQDDDITIQRKIQEIFRALDVEKKFSKVQIVEMYLNVISLSQNTKGVKSAAFAYFGKELKDLTLLECVAIAAIPKYPTYYDPIRNPDNNLLRRNVILQDMLKQGKITQEEFDGAYNVPLYINSGSGEDNSSSTDKIHSYYIDTVIDEAIESLMGLYGIDRVTASRRLYSTGLEIVINMDPIVQSAMEEVYTDNTNKYFNAVQGIKAQSAMVVMDPGTGNVLGIVGGRGEKTSNRGLNRATQSYRQIGSAIKPLSIYAYAIEKGLINYGSPLNDFPDPDTKYYTGYDKETNKYWPANTPSSVGYNGIVPLVWAVQKSLNTVPVRLVQQLGAENSFNFLRNSLGFTSLVESGVYNNVILSDIAVSPLALGSFTKGVTVLEVTQAYSVFANGGVSVKGRTISMIRDDKGEILIDNRYNSDQEQVISEQTAYIMTSLLLKVVNHSQGTANYMFAKRTFDKDVLVCGKTGTTNDDRDRYFVGYTPDFVASVWFGYDNNKSLATYGALTENPATRAWIEVMNIIYAEYSAQGIHYNKTFTKPYGIYENIEYCTISGKRATEACKNDLQTVLGGSMNYKVVDTGVFTASTIPHEYCDVHVMVKWDKVTKAISFDGCDCPEKDIIEVGLRRIQLRSFPASIYISDSQYTYVEIPSNYTFPTSTKVPFFYNLLEDGKRPGLTYGSTEPYNRICTEHYH